ncbi:MAG: DUF1232 domain-containing protein [Betaproteobacteria bacterium]|nr:DUF1232 domain-containing protein [Betaproteobacteria bacterium]
MRGVLARLAHEARRLKTEILALYFAARHPGTPWTARLLVAFIVGYALSPIDLIPDFIPVLGYLDELILLPLLLSLALRLIPPPVLAECRQRAKVSAERSCPSSRIATFVIFMIWLLAFTAAASWAYDFVATGPAI